MKKLVLAFTICIISIAHAQKADPSLPLMRVTAPLTPVFYLAKIIPCNNNTFGYDIYADGKLKIHQPTIPGQPGNQGFKTKQAAEKVAEMVIGKMKKGEMPPTVNKEELQNLNAL